MGHKYAKEMNGNIAIAVGRSLPISTKTSVEICRFIRKRGLQDAKDALQRVINKKEAVPFTKYRKSVGHRKKMGPGRYPKKASMEILGLLKSVEANAQIKGLNTSNLIINHICCHKASRPLRHGRKRNRKVKRSHVEIIVEEIKKEVKEKKVEKKEEEVKKDGKVEEEVEKKTEKDKKEESKDVKVETKEVKEKKVEERKEIEKEKPKTGEKTEEKEDKND